MSWQRNLMVGLLIAWTVTSLEDAQAALLLYEPFDYTVGVLHGQGGSELGFDAGSTWAAAGLGTADVRPGSLPFGAMETVGNRFRHRIVGQIIHGRATRGLDITRTSGTLWMSHLTRFVIAKHLAAGAMIRDGTTDEFGAKHKNTFESPGNARLIYNGVETAAAGSALGSGITYMFVTKFTNLGTTGAQARLWILEADEHNSIGPGNEESDLNALVPANRQVTLNLAGTAPTLTGTEVLALWFHDDFIATGDQEFDELRIGELASDVLNVAIPEPSTAMLLVFGLLGLGMRRNTRGVYRLGCQ